RGFEYKSQHTKVTSRPGPHKPIQPPLRRRTSSSSTCLTPRERRLYTAYHTRDSPCSMGHAMTQAVRERRGTGVEAIPNFIGGSWERSGKGTVRPVTDPGTGEVL